MIEVFDVPPEVRINNSLSNRFTVIEVAGLDRRGLLFNLTSILSQLNLNIGSAHIATFGEKAADVFYVTDFAGAKISDAESKEQIRDALLKGFGTQKARQYDALGL